MNEEDNELRVSFMMPGHKDTCTNKFKWPAREDILDISKEHVLHVISMPKEQGSSRRKFFQLPADDVKVILQAFRG